MAVFSPDYRPVSDFANTIKLSKMIFRKLYETVTNRDIFTRESFLRTDNTDEKENQLRRARALAEIPRREIHLRIP